MISGPRHQHDDQQRAATEHAATGANQPSRSTSRGNRAEVGRGTNEQQQAAQHRAARTQRGEAARRPLP